MPFKGMPDSASSSIVTSSILNDGMLPSLVTPGQLLQRGLVTASASLSMSSQTAQKDVEVVHVSSPELTSAPAPEPVSAKAPQPVLAQGPPPLSAQASPPLLALQQPPKTGQELILPLPSLSDYKVHGAPMHAYHSYRGGHERGRGRGNVISHSATKFTEEFDFTVMNEKFNKDEVWGHIGKSSRAQEDADGLQNEDSVESLKVEVKPVYVKDDFFDSLSCDSLGGGSRNGRTRFSEQMRRDTETFGDFPRHRGGRGGRGPFHGG